MENNRAGILVLVLNTIAFTVCFACWMLNGVLVAFLMENHVFPWTESQVGWLIGAPVLTGSLLRLPIGALTDRFGGRIMFPLIMVASALPMYLLSMANSYYGFLLASLGFGIAGSSFATGVAYTSLWFKKEHQGTALGIFGAGNVGAALTSMGAPRFLGYLTRNGEDIEGWRNLPKCYAAMLVVMTIVFLLCARTRKVDNSNITGLATRLAPLKNLRVWRFGLYYFLTFGCFVALSQWLIGYYVNAYTMSVATAGLMASAFSLPSGLVRALGGYLSDRFGARRVMYVVLTSCLVCFALLIVPRMEIESPGKGVQAKAAGAVTEVSNGKIVAGGITYNLQTDSGKGTDDKEWLSGVLVLPKSESRQVSTVKVGDTVQKKQLLARGVTHIYFQANLWVFTALVFIAGFMMGIGNAAVYKHIPDYFPLNVGVVGGIVGVLGGLGGFVCPILFGYLLEYTGIWTTCWMFMSVLAAICLGWMHIVVQIMLHKEAPSLRGRIEHMPLAGQQG